MKMMVVDDSNIIRRQISRFVNSEEIDVVASASNGVEAVEYFRRNTPDMITMDLTMPELDGIGCIERIMELNPETRILVISALVDKATALEALKKGAHGFLCKPFNEDELRSALKELMKNE